MFDIDTIYSTVMGYLCRSIFIHFAFSAEGGVFSVLSYDTHLRYSCIFPSSDFWMGVKPFISSTAWWNTVGSRPLHN